MYETANGHFLISLAQRKELEAAKQRAETAEALLREAQSRMVMVVFDKDFDLKRRIDAFLTGKEPR